MTRAIATGTADFVLAPARPTRFVAAHAALVVASASRNRVRPLLGILSRQTGVDFAQYKPATVERRVHRRMAVRQTASLDDYTTMLTQSPAEVTALFKDLLISVTKFFREPEVFDAVKRDVIPALVDATRAGDAIRVWVAGCATGEEAYSLAMLFDEHFEAGGRPRDVKIFATDIDRAALDVASQGVYPESIAADISPERLERYFVRQGEAYQVARFVRRQVVFANHDLTRDPPFTRVALVSCRNLLIYFGAQLQQRVVRAFRFALRPGGYLLLGSSETTGEAADDFVPLDGSLKIYRSSDSPRRAGMSAVSDRKHTGEFRPERAGVRGRPDQVGPRELLAQAALDALVDTHVPPTLLLDERHEILHIFGRPSPLVKLPTGAATLNILELVPPRVASMIALGTHKALRDREEVRYAALATEFGDATVIVRPVDAKTAPAAATTVTLLLATAHAATEGEHATPFRDAEQQISDLQQELQFARESLQATIEELETSNEELQATNEELLASNEELQSTNEELQSVNEELHTVNAEYQEKIQQLIELNDDLDNFLASTHIGSVFLNADLQIVRFSASTATMLNILPRDVGRPIHHLSMPFEEGEFLETLARVLRSQQGEERALVTRERRSLLVRVMPYAGEAAARRGLVLSFVDVTALRRAEQRVAQVLDALHEQVAVLDREGRVLLVNRAWREFALSNGGRADSSTCVGADYLETCRRAAKAGAEGAQAVLEGLESVLAGKTLAFEHEYPCHSPTEERWFLLFARSFPSDDGGVVISHIGVTERHRLLLEQARGKS